MLFVGKTERSGSISGGEDLGKVKDEREPKE